MWSRHSAPLPRAVPVRGDEMPRDVFRSTERIMLIISPPGQQRHDRPAGDGYWFRLSAFPRNWECSSCRTARSGKGRTDRCGEANPLPRGPFCNHGGRGKAERKVRAILKRGASQTDARVSTIVLSETRGL